MTLAVGLDTEGLLIRHCSRLGGASSSWLWWLWRLADVAGLNGEAGREDAGLRLSGVSSGGLDGRAGEASTFSPLRRLALRAELFGP